MPILYHFFPSTSFILTLLQCLNPASSQSNSPAAAATTTSALTASSTATVSSDYNFTYPVFPDHYGSGIQVSYKDTIDVSWVANALQHSPDLEIQCWKRNDSSSFIYYQTPPSYTHDLLTSTSPSDPSYLLPLAPYRQYSPCELQLQDPSGSGESVMSVAIFISQETNASTMGVTWSADDPAPKVAVDAGVGTVNSGSAAMHTYKVVVGGLWTFVGAVAAAMVLL